MRATTAAQRKAARKLQALQQKGVNLNFAGVNPFTAGHSPLAIQAGPLATMGTPQGMPDYFGVANWANSPLPQLDAAGRIVPGTGIRKFVDALPGLCAVSGPTPTLGQCIPLATPMAPPLGSAFLGPASDYYEIGLTEYPKKLHTDLPATKLRGYADLNPATFVLGQPVNQYLGPLILATKGRPVRVKFTNLLPKTSAGGNLFIPTDTTYMGAGMGPDGTPYAQNRATLHLHGGNTPWISDGTPHQWTVPANEDGTNFFKGLSSQDVPDMPASGPGSMTFYWTNQQSGRLMFYHDHAYGITRLNVYAGEAAGYLLTDPVKEAALAAAFVPGTIVTDPLTGVIVTADLAHLVPLVIQDKTFVPDGGAAGGQLAATDPTWDTAKWGGAGSLWFPHVYMPNQNPYDPSGANPWGRWDWGPWFWPPQNPNTFVPDGQAKPCTSVAYPGVLLTCPGTPNPSGTPEGFMDTMVVNGTPYPTLTVDPVAYRFQILSAGNDRALNLGLYVAEGLTIGLTKAGTGYSPAPAAPPLVTITPANGAVATAQVSAGEVTAVSVTGAGAGYLAPPALTFTDPGGGVGALATAIINGLGQVTAVAVTAGGTSYTAATTVTIADPGGCTVGPGCAAATGTTAVVPAGSLLGIALTTPPTPPFTSAPTITIDPPSSGIQATAFATVGTEVRMVDAFAHTATSTPPLCSAATNFPDAGGLVEAALDGAGVPINGTGLPLNCWPTSWPTDGRDGGVPDPATAGPPFIQIGTESGLLPNPAVIPSSPVGFEYNRRSITVLNIFQHGLLLGPAERADVIVDFSQFAGKTLILYNDAPAPVPAFDPRTDYYTGAPDQTTTGGAPSTLAGYGPNTRTIMQIIVNATGAGAPFSVAPLQNATTGLPGIFAANEDSIIVPETAYGAPTDTYVRIQDNSIAFFNNSALAGLKLTNPGAGYAAAPNVFIAPPASGTPATATATIGAAVKSITITNPGANYASAPTVAFSGGGGTGAAGTAVLTTRSVARLTITNGGSGYTSPPTVTIAAPAGCVFNTTTCVRATATVTVRGNGQRNVNGFTMTNVGAGYTSVPAVTFSGGGGTGAAATAVLTAASVKSVTITNGGSGYTSAPTVAFSGGGGAGAAGTAVMTPIVVTGLTLTNAGSGYNAAPLVTIDLPGCSPVSTTCAQATAVALAPSQPLLPKAIHELFTLDYGRMNAVLGVELPLTNFFTQTTIPYGYVDPPTEIFGSDETQYWKITHNGVDTHWIHFHLFNVQVLNRVGWDGTVKPPDANELSWKDTVRMNPLEDIIVALRPLKQNLPWPVPISIRPLDVTAAVGSSLTNQFANVDPANQPATVVNDLTNFGWEYVWHCHILGHEENDMMRAMVLGVAPQQAGPVTMTLTGNGANRRVVVSWTGGSVVDRTGFTIQRATSATGPFATVGTVGPNVFTFTDNPPGGTYFYQVIANNVVGYTRAYAPPITGWSHPNYPAAPTVSALSITR
jgi:FtsP/CotA-like multicopper oxidase with cupredoxin domain